MILEPTGIIFMSHRIEKFVSTLKHNLAEIFLKESNNPDFKFVVVSHIEVSSDLKNAKIFVKTIIGDIDSTVDKLNKSRGFIKVKLSELMYLKYIPEINFLKDKGTDIEKLIDELKREGR